MKEEIKMYPERAEKFRRNAEFNFKNGDYDLAMFHIEQSMQELKEILWRDRNIS